MTNLLRITVLIINSCILIACISNSSNSDIRHTATTEDFYQRGPAGVKAKTHNLQPMPLERVALVIGNSAYKNSGLALQNPVNDARAMTNALRNLGFKITPIENASLTVMNDAVESFKRQLAHSQGVGLFYFAGHGVQSNSGLNYLIPIDYVLGTQIDLPKQAIDADGIRQAMEQANNALNIVILDACRNNPLPTRGMGMKKRGLASMTSAKGTLIALATAPGSIALDGEGNNGAYTSALLRYINTPGIDIRQMLDSVAIEVAQATNNEQQPWYHSSVRGNFAFIPDTTVTSTSSVLTSIQPVTSDTTRNININFAILADKGNNQPIQLKDGDVLHSNDGYFFHIQTTNNKKNYLYLFQIDAIGKVFRLFPSKQYHTQANPIAANVRITLPNAREVFYLDNTIGQEKFYFIASDTPLPALESLDNGTLDDIMNSGITLRGPAGVREKTNIVSARFGDTPVETQEFSFKEKLSLVHTLTINHE